MPRKPRLSVPGALHHIMARGIEGTNIFNDDEDRQQFLLLLERGLAKVGFKCYAWVLMSNHYHLLIRANENPLSLLMKPLNSEYARWFRKKHKSRGYLFQDRFKSIVTQDQGYIEQLVRYIHLNPLRSGMCKNMADLDTYPWSGHAALVGMRKFNFQDIDAVLKCFGNRKVALQAYRSFLVADTKADDAERVIDTIRNASSNKENRQDHRMWVLGDNHFVRSALEHDRLKRLTILRRTNNDLTLEDIAQNIAHAMKLDVTKLRFRGRENDQSKFRKIFAALAHRDYGFSVAEIARFLEVGSSSVFRMLELGRRSAEMMDLTIKQ